MADKKHAIFVYGTLMFEYVVEKVLAKNLVGKTALLPGFHRYRIKNRLYPAIAPKKDGVVKGKLFYVSDDDLILLDHYEGCEYVKQEVEVEVQDFVETEGDSVEVKTSSSSTPLKPKITVKALSYVWGTDSSLLYGEWEPEVHFQAKTMADFIGDEF